MKVNKNLLMLYLTGFVVVHSSGTQSSAAEIDRVIGTIQD